MARTIVVEIKDHSILSVFDGQRELPFYARRADRDEGYRIPSGDDVWLIIAEASGQVMDFGDFDKITKALMTVGY